MRNKLCVLLSVLLMISIVLPVSGCKVDTPEDKNITAKTFTPEATYTAGTSFTLTLGDYFNNVAEGVEYTTTKGSIKNGVLTISLSAVGQVEVKVTAKQDGKEANLSFTLNVVAAPLPDITAKTFSPASSYGEDEVFRLTVANYFNNVGDAVFTTNHGEIVEGELSIKLDTVGALDVEVIGTRAGKSAKLSFTLNVVATWNVQPTVTDVFFDDFSQGIRSNVWEVCDQKWGQGNNGVRPRNVFYSKNTELAAAEGAESGGLTVIQSNGDLFEQANRRREGGAIISRDAFGPGLYEVRMKPVPRLGQCTAAWTYWNGGGNTIETNRYSEIDIEMAMNADYRRWSGTTYKYFYDWNILAERGTVTEVKSDGINNGDWNVWAFEWRTDTANGDNKVVWYLNGEKMFEIKDYTPEYTATFWIGNWFPEDLSWVGVPSFETAYMYIDWVRITSYDDPVKQGARGGGTSGGTATDLGNNPIPQNQYISNSSFDQANAGAFAGWETTGNVTGGGASQLNLVEGAKITQTILGQYSGYSFELLANARVTAGSGKLKVYAEFLFGSVVTAKSQEIVFESSTDFATKSLNFTIPTPASQSMSPTNLRIVVETESGTTARIDNVQLFLK